MLQVIWEGADSTFWALHWHQVLNCDCDTGFSTRFRRALQEAGVTILFIPMMVPNRSAYAERSLLSIMTEYHEWIALFGEVPL